MQCIFISTLFPHTELMFVRLSVAWSVSNIYSVFCLRFFFKSLLPCFSRVMRPLEAAISYRRPDIAQACTRISVPPISMPYRELYRLLISLAVPAKSLSGSSVLLGPVIMTLELLTAITFMWIMLKSYSWQGTKNNTVRTLFINSVYKKVITVHIQIIHID